MKTYYIDYEDIVRVLKTKKRINIIGPPGSGKTTLCKKISIDLQMKLINLDDILFDSDCNLVKNKQEVLLKNLVT
jgi:adenylate kinase family enzyme